MIRIVFLRAMAIGIFVSASNLVAESSSVQNGALTCITSDGIEAVAFNGEQAVQKSTNDFQMGGSHLLVDLYDCDASLITTVAYVEQVMNDAALAAGATIVGSKFHQFTPQGVSGALVLAESHLTIHTWPEHGYCAIDIFTCGAMNNYAAFEVLKKGFAAKTAKLTDIQRGRDTVLDVTKR